MMSLLVPIICIFFQIPFLQSKDLYLLPPNATSPLLKVIGPDDPDRLLTTPELIKSRGWGVQTHYAMTPDGFSLGLHRIVNPDGSPVDTEFRPIILQHGLLLSSFCWVTNDPNTGFYGEEPDDEDVGGNLGFELANRGYDVWLSNTRGNIYSRNHSSFSPESRDFWDFSFDEMIKYDVPTVINYVRDEADSDTISWIGHSQGTLMMFGFLSQNHDYDNVINPFIALAPVAYVTNIKGLFLAVVSAPGNGMELVGGRFPTPDIHLPSLTNNICRGNELDETCVHFAYAVNGGFNTSNINKTRAGVYNGNGMSGDSSQKNVAHFSFNHQQGKFQSYDYQLKNMEKYGSNTPPQYNLQDITCPNIALFSSSGDFLSDSKDVSRLVSELRVDLILNRVINDTDFSHVNFLWGYETGKLINSPVIEILQNDVS